MAAVWDFLGRGGIGSVVVAVGVALVIAGALAALMVLRRGLTAHRAAAVALVLSPVGAVLAVVGVLTAVTCERAELVAALLGTLPHTTTSRPLAPAWSALGGGGLAAAVALLVPVVLVAAFAVTIPAIRRGHLKGTARLTPLLVVVGLAPLLLAAVAILHWQSRVSSAVAASLGAADDARPAALAGALGGAADELGAARVGLYAAGAIALLVAVASAVRLGRLGWRVSRAGLIGALLIGAAGAGAFAATRALAYDAARPLPVTSAPSLTAAQLAGIRPPQLSNCPARVGVRRNDLFAFVTLRDGQALLDGEPVASAAQLGEQLAAARANFLLLHPHDRPPQFVALIADGALPIGEARPWLAALSAGGDARPALLAVVTHTVETRTLGPITRATPCPLPITPHATTATTAATWDQLAAALLTAP